MRQESRTENDYIAEYIREKYPRLLGIDFSLWKIARSFSEIFKNGSHKNILKSIADVRSFKSSTQYDEDPEAAVDDDEDSEAAGDQKEKSENECEM